MKTKVTTVDQIPQEYLEEVRRSAAWTAAIMCFAGYGNAEAPSKEELFVKVWNEWCDNEAKAEAKRVRTGNYMSFLSDLYGVEITEEKKAARTKALALETSAKNRVLEAERELERAKEMAKLERKEAEGEWITAGGREMWANVDLKKASVAFRKYEKELENNGNHS